MRHSRGWRMRTFGAVIVAVLAFAASCLADEQHDWALFQAAYNGDLTRIQAELNAGANISAEIAPPDHWLPIPLNAAVAAVDGHSSQALGIVLSKATLSRDGRFAALLLAIDFEDVDCVTLLAQNLKPFTASDPPLVHALADRASELIAAGVQELERRTIFQQPLTGMPRSLALGRFAKTPDGPAVVILKLLVDAGADINREAGFFPRETGLIAATRVGDRYLVQALLELKASLPDGWTRADLDQGILVGASRNGNMQAVTDLLAAGVTPSAKSALDEYSLAEASRYAQGDIVDKLLGAGANPNQWGKDEESPLVGAVRAGSPSIVTTLLKAGAASSNKGDNGWPLRVAVRLAERSIVQMLLDAGASLMERDQKGRTVLHDFNLSDHALTSSGTDTRALRPENLDIIKYLGTRGFDLSATDTEGRSIISSTLAWRGTDLELLKQLLDNHAPVTKEALRRALETENVPALEIMVRDASDLSDPDLLNDAFQKISHQPELAAILLRAGVPLPTNAYEVQNAFVRAASIGATDIVASMMERGVSASTRDYSQSALSAAVTEGHASTAKLLFEKGADPKSSSYDGGIVFHDLIRTDIAKTTRSPAFDDNQQRAIAALITAGLDATAKDKNGKTPLDLAAGHPGTLSRATTAIGLATLQQSKVHEAVRNDDLKALTDLRARGADLNALDSLGRSPLTLALQLKQYAIADFLLSTGVELTLEPRNGYQSADVDSAADERLTHGFMLRLLRAQLLDLGPNMAAIHPQVSLKHFDDNQAMRLADAVWTYSCSPCRGKITLHGNNHASLPIDSSRTDDKLMTTYQTRQMANEPIAVSGALNFELTFTVNFSLNIPGCSFDFVTEPTCLPQVNIHNPNAPSELTVQTRTGPVPLFPTTIIHAQQGINSSPVNPGETITLDRSNGAIQLSIEPVVSKVFTLSVDVIHSIGPTIPQPDTLEQGERAKVYAQLAKWKDEMDKLPMSGQPNISAQKKTLATARHVLSARAVERNYPSHVREWLRSRAVEIASLDKQTLELRDAILSQSELTAGDLDLLVARVDQLMATAPASAKTSLQQIRDQLALARTGLQNSTDKLRIFSERFFTDIDPIVRDYQALILELAQYIPVDDLGSVLTATVRNDIASRLKASNSVIDDSTRGGQGAKIRAAFGLPKPRTATK
jgi:ankyrin repeat protein